jgi:hypothetical protein
MSNFLNWNYIYISGLRIKYGEQVGYILIIPPDCSVAGKATRVEHQTAVAHPPGLALNPLNSPPVINNKIALVTITKRKEYQITGFNTCSQYFGFRDVSFFSGLHKPHVLPLARHVRVEAKTKAAVMRLNYQTLRENSLGLTTAKIIK